MYSRTMSIDVCFVRVPDSQLLDCEFLVRENSQLRDQKKALTNELKKKNDEAGQHKLMETTVRYRLEKVEGGHYKVIDVDSFLIVIET